jgi:hypothetical protein
MRKCDGGNAPLQKSHKFLAPNNNLLFHCNTASSSHLNPQPLPGPLVDVVGDGYGGSNLAEVWEDSAVEAGKALGAKDVTKEADRVRLLLREAQVQTG